MRLDEFAFFNAQLGAMLGNGMPLEGAIRQLCAQMRRGRLRRQLCEVEAALSRGEELVAAARAAGLPELYLQTLAVGVRGGNLPGLLVQVADYYRRANLLGIRLRGLMVYPTLVLLAMAAVAVCFHLILLPEVIASDLTTGFMWEEEAVASYPSGLFLSLPLGLLAAWLIVLAVKPFRTWVTWRLKVFQYPRLARLAAMFAALLQSGVPLPECLDLMAALHAGTPAAGDLERMRAAVREGRAGMDALAAECRWFPGLFRWLLAIHPDDPASAFERAADLYERRAAAAEELLLYVAMPMAVMLLGLFVLLQFTLMWMPVIQLLDMIGATRLY